MAIKKAGIAAVFLLVAALLVAQADSVFITRSGKKYHRASCKTIQKSQVTEISREAAIARGYEACKVCQP